MDTLMPSEEGQAKITAARKSKGWLIKEGEMRPLQAASKVLVRRYGRENGWEENDAQWVRDLDNYLRIDGEQANEIRIKITRLSKGSIRDRIERIIEEEEICAKDVSYGSWGRFAGRKKHAIKERTFQAYCKILGLEWQAIVETEPPPTARRKPRKFKRSLNNLPFRDHTAFIGRNKELKKLLGLLSSEHPIHRISVEGEGGLGKTALVLEVAYRCLHASLGATASPKIPTFDAIIFVSAQSQRLIETGILQRLRSDRTQRDIFRAIANTLDIPELIYLPLEDRLERLRQELSRQSILLIVDNLETVEDRDAVLALVYELPTTFKIVVTTREPASSFTRLRLDSLLPEDALDLIFHQVEAKDLEISPEAAEKLYEKTTGLPAAIVYTIGQLAAEIPLEEILDRLAHATDDVSRYCFEGSFNVLSPSARHLLMALALFPQMALREAIATVAAIEDPVTLADNLTHLQKLSLIKQIQERYTMLPATRSYVFVQLENSGEFATAARTQWLNWFLDYVRQHGSKEFRNWQDYGNLKREWTNLAEAISWCLSSKQYDLFKEFWLYLAGFTRFEGYWDERLAWLDCLLEAATREGDRATIPRVLLDKVHTLVLIDRPAQREEAIALCQEALAIPDGLEVKFRFHTITHLAVLFINQKQFTLAQEWLDKGEIFLTNPDLSEEERLQLQLYLSYHQGQIELETGNLQRARVLCEQCIEQAQKMNWQLMEMYTYGHLIKVELAEDNLTEAERLLKRVLPCIEQNHDRRGIALCHRDYAVLEQKRGNLKQAYYWANLAREQFEKLKMFREFQEMNRLCQEWERSRA